MTLFFHASQGDHQESRFYGKRSPRTTDKRPCRYVPGRALHDPEHDLYSIKLERKELAPLCIDHELVTSPEFRQCAKEYREIAAYYEQAIEVSVKDRPFVPCTPREFLKTVADVGKEGVTIQRYKGLGEMNPEQLWSTTMDPERRSMMKVSISDAIEADQVFTVLMGDNVQSRKAFIQENALDVRNLDI